MAGYYPLTTKFYGGMTVFHYLDPKPPMSGPLSAFIIPGGIWGAPAFSYQLFFPAIVPGLRPVGTTRPTLINPYGIFTVDLSTLLPGFPQKYAFPPVGTPLTLQAPWVSMPLRINEQLLPVDGSGGRGTATNLQSYTIE